MRTASVDIVHVRAKANDSSVATLFVGEFGTTLEKFQRDGVHSMDEGLWRHRLLMKEASRTAALATHQVLFEAPQYHSHPPLPLCVMEQLVPPGANAEGELGTALLFIFLLSLSYASILGFGSETTTSTAQFVALLAIELVPSIVLLVFYCSNPLESTSMLVHPAFSFVYMTPPFVRVILEVGIGSGIFVAHLFIIPALVSLHFFCYHRRHIYANRYSALGIDRASSREREGRPSAHSRGSRSPQRGAADEEGQEMVSGPHLLGRERFTEEAGCEQVQTCPEATQ